MCMKLKVFRQNFSKNQYLHRNNERWNHPVCILLLCMHTRAFIARTVFFSTTRNPYNIIEYVNLIYEYLYYMFYIFLFNKHFNIVSLILYILIYYFFDVSQKISLYVNGQYRSNTSSSLHILKTRHTNKILLFVFIILFVFKISNLYVLLIRML